MKRLPPILTTLILTAATGFSADETGETRSLIERHSVGSEKLADDQDELSADVQQLAIEQTAQQVIDLLNEVEGIMDESTDNLAERDTGGKTIAAQTEIIEKIHAAAKAKQQQGGGGQAGGAMMDMMERMMGKKEGEGGDGGKKKGKGPGSKGGEGQTGDSDAANGADGGKAGGETEERRVPKAAGTAGKSLPAEFQEALDAYNRGLEGK